MSHVCYWQKIWPTETGIFHDLWVHSIIIHTKWTGERFGNTEKTETSEEFKRLDSDLEKRRQGIEALSLALNRYVKSIGNFFTLKNLYSFFQTNRQKSAHKT